MNDKDLEIKKFMAEELAKGTGLSEVQSLVNAKFDVKLTFMEVRILAAEIENVDWGKDEPEAAPPEEEAPAGEEAVPAAGKTIVESSKVLRPGALAGGTVTFASGASAEWLVDQRGQLGLDNVKGEPDENDIREFQLELQKLFGR